MTGYIGYIRVSTVKQGTKGVSLQEQRDAIVRYAERHQLNVTLWLTEMETAAKHGRPIFTKALKLLRTGKASGIILHKLDRGARNLRDWAAIGELSDQGIDVHFVTESIDLQSRGGRLSADIQAVVAADYIRNLKEETRKGFYGRLKQGLYPLRAPLGYLDQGGGKAKIVDPATAAFVRKAFELYSTGRFNLHTLNDELYRLGLRNRSGGKLHIAPLAAMLNNPFYMGLIRIQKTNETFMGVHEPLVMKALFERVKAVLRGKTNARSQKHDFTYRRLIQCAGCQYSLIAEKQKGHVYYRCHIKECPQTGIREETLKQEVLKFYSKIRFSEQEQAYYTGRLTTLKSNWVDHGRDLKKSHELQLHQVKDRLNRLTDAYLDQALDKESFNERRAGLMLEQRTIEQNLANSKGKNSDVLSEVEIFLELARNAWLSHQIAKPLVARKMLGLFTSNRRISSKNLMLEPSLVAQEIVNRYKDDDCAQERNIPRTWDKIIDWLINLKDKEAFPDISFMFEMQDEADLEAK